MMAPNKFDNQPLVSVVMNCYNGEKFLRNAINSVYKQTYKNWEIIFWDNCSTDNSAKICQSYDAKIRYYKGEKTIPLGEARNKAIEQCNGKYIAFLDCDDLWKSNKLLEQVLIFENDTSIALVYTFTEVMNETGKRITINKNENELYSEITFRTLFENYDLAMSSVIILASVLESLDSAFDFSLTHCEDYDLFLRICYKNKVIRINKYHTSYRIHSNMSTVNNYQIGAIEKQYILSKMKELFPKFEEKYMDLLLKKEKKIAWQLFLSNILDNDPKKARNILKPYIFTSIKNLFFYTTTFFSSKFIISIWNLNMRMKGRIPQNS